MFLHSMSAVPAFFILFYVFHPIEMKIYAFLVISAICKETYAPRQQSFRDCYENFKINDTFDSKWQFIFESLTSIGYKI